MSVQLAHRRVAALQLLRDIGTQWPRRHAHAGVALRRRRWRRLVVAEAEVVAVAVAVAVAEVGAVAVAVAVVEVGAIGRRVAQHRHRIARHGPSAGPQQRADGVGREAAAIAVGVEDEVRVVRVVVRVVVADVQRQSRHRPVEGVPAEPAHSRAANHRSTDGRSVALAAHKGRIGGYSAPSAGRASRRNRMGRVWRKDRTSTE